MRGVLGSFKRLLHGLELLKEYEFAIGGTYMLTRQTLSEVESAVQLAVEYGFKVLSFFPIVPLGRAMATQEDPWYCGQAIEQTYQTLAALSSRLKDRIRLEWIRLRTGARPYPLQDCLGDRILTISPTGYLGPCPWYTKRDRTFFVGNVLETPFTELRKACSEKFRRFLEHRKQKLTLCLSCPELLICGRGCPAVSYPMEHRLRLYDPLCPWAEQLSGELEG
jgi:radical SAM protein with 4Fe4S-binding SPASM domain